MAASPDGVIDDKTIVEIKCPYSSRNSQITSITVPYLSENGLKKSHQYYYQVQGQLFCTNASKCHFVVYTHEDLKCFVIERDNEFILDMVDQLKNFYHTHFKPLLLVKYVYKNYNQFF